MDRRGNFGEDGGFDGERPLEGVKFSPMRIGPVVHPRFAARLRLTPIENPFSTGGIPREQLFLVDPRRNRNELLEGTPMGLVVRQSMDATMYNNYLDIPSVWMTLPSREIQGTGQVTIDSVYRGGKTQENYYFVSGPDLVTDNNKRRADLITKFSRRCDAVATLQEAGRLRKAETGIRELIQEYEAFKSAPENPTLRVFLPAESFGALNFEKAKIALAFYDHPGAVAAMASVIADDNNIKHRAFQEFLALSPLSHELASRHKLYQKAVVALARRQPDRALAFIERAIPHLRHNQVALSLRDYLKRYEVDPGSY
jgi:hypothetical protein